MLITTRDREEEFLLQLPRNFFDYKIETKKQKATAEARSQKLLYMLVQNSRLFHGFIACWMETCRCFRSAILRNGGFIWCFVLLLVLAFYSFWEKKRALRLKRNLLYFYSMSLKSLPSPSVIFLLTTFSSLLLEIDQGYLVNIIFFCS